MTFRVLGTEQADDWQKLLDGFEYHERDVFLGPYYAAAYEKIDPTTKALLAYDEHDGIVTLMPLLHRTRPARDLTCMGFGGIFSNDPLPWMKSRNEFTRSFGEWAQRESIVSIFNLAHPIIGGDVVPGANWEREKPVIVIVPELFNQGLSHGRQSDMNAADEVGLRVRYGTAVEFETYYSAAMERVQAVSRWRLPRRYFEALDAMPNRERAVIFTELNGEVQSGAIFLLGRSAIYYHLSASTPGHARGSNDVLIRHAANEMARTMNKRWFFLGGGVGRGEDDRVFKYKASFGGMVRWAYSWHMKLWGAEYQRLVEADPPPPGTRFFPEYRWRENIA